MDSGKSTSSYDWFFKHWFFGLFRGCDYSNLHKVASLDSNAFGFLLMAEIKRLRKLSKYRAELQQSLAQAEAEIASLMSALVSERVVEEDTREARSEQENLYGRSTLVEMIEHPYVFYSADVDLKFEICL